MIIKQLNKKYLLGLAITVLFMMALMQRITAENIQKTQTGILLTLTPSQFLPNLQIPLHTATPTLPNATPPTKTPAQTNPPPASTTIAIPKAKDWTDRGIAIVEGTDGEWDRYLWGGFTATAVKKNGLYYLYYQGANGYSDLLETVTWRAIGVATSSDGLHFTKHPDNPLFNWFPHNNLEEGAVSAGATIIDDIVHLFYGANTELNVNAVNADGRLTTAQDGINFTDQGIFLDHANSGTWASGDELFPMIAFEHNGRYFIYYIPNGVPQTGQLGVAWGDDLSQLQTAAATSNNQPVTAWGAGGYAKIGLNKYALFVNNVRQNKTFVYIVSLNEPQNLGPVQETYQFSDYNQATFLLDQETQTWFMYYRNADATHYRIKTAPVTTGTP